MGRKPGRHYSVESDAFWSKPCKNYTSIKWGYVSGPDRPHFSRVVRGCGHLHGKASLLFSLRHWKFASLLIALFSTHLCIESVFVMGKAFP